MEKRLKNVLDRHIAEHQNDRYKYNSFEVKSATFTEKTTIQLNYISSVKEHKETSIQILELKRIF